MEPRSCSHRDVGGRDQDQEGTGVCDVLWRHYWAKGTEDGVGQTRLEVVSDV